MSDIASSLAAQPGADGFFDALASAQRERVPCVWRAPLGPKPLSQADVFGWAVQGADAVRRGDRRSRFRIYDGDGGERSLPAERLPRHDDGDMAGFIARLDATSRENGLVINNLQATSGPAWEAARALLGPLYARIGQNVGGASCELFAGAYRRGAFGVHKDEQDVITLVVEGPKRFVLWPYAAFADRAEVAPGSELRTVLLDRFDHRASMDGAIVLEGRPGDVFFWPAEWWHVAESDGVLCTTLGLGLLHGATLAKLVESVASETLYGAPGLPTQLPRAGEAMATLLGALADPELQARIEDKVMAVASAWGGLALPDPRPASLAHAAQDTRVRGVAGALHLREHGSTLTWAAHGAVYHYPAMPALTTLLSRVASGEAWTIEALTHGLADAQVALSALEHVLALLDSLYAIERAPAS